MNDGLLDTNVVLHARTTDEHSKECREFLRMLRGERIRAHLDPLVVHELTYVLPRYIKKIDRAEVATYLISIL